MTPRRLCLWHWVLVTPDHRRRCPVCNRSVEEYHPPYQPPQETEVLRGTPFIRPR